MVKNAERGELDTKSLDMYRRSDRNKGKEDCNIKELSMKRAVEEDNYDKEDIPNLLQSSQNVL